jgi:uncharacterized protein YxjI
MSIEQQNFLQETNVLLCHQISAANVAFDYQTRLQYTLCSNPSQALLATFTERKKGFLNTVARQLTQLHRSFHIDVYNSQGELVITFQRKFTKINSTVNIVIDGIVVGKSVERWHPIKRKYDLYVLNTKTGEFDLFGKIKSAYLSYKFPIYDAIQDKELVASINRKWDGVINEFYTDSGVYDLQFGNLGLNERAVVLGCTVSLDLDYFSRNTRNNRNNR